MAVHADIGFVGQGPGLRHIDPLRNAQHVTDIDVEHFLHGVLDTLELRLLENIEILRDQILHIADHFQVLDEFDLRGANGTGDVRPEIGFGEQRVNLVRNHGHVILSPTNIYAWRETIVDFEKPDKLPVRISFSVPLYRYAARLPPAGYNFPAPPA